MTKKPIDKDAIIAGLKDNLSNLSKELNACADRLTEAESRADENFRNGRAWKDMIDNAERARKDSLANERAANEKRLEAERQLAFAEGYIAALNVEPYKPIPEEKAW